MKLLVEITIFTLLTGCGVAPDAQPSHTPTAPAPCKPDTVYVEIGSSAWWGVLPATTDSFSLPDAAGDTTGGLWYWHTVNDTLKLPARVIRHAYPKTDTAFLPEIVYRDTATGRWHMIADSLQQELVMLDTIRRKNQRTMGGFLGFLLVAVGGFLAYMYIQNKQHAQHAE